MIIKRGAEAIIHHDNWHGRDAIVKERVPKGYRAPQLDTELRRARTRKEALLLVEARDLGVLTPRIYDIDMARSSLVMEYISGTLAKDVLQNSDDRNELAKQIGESAGKLHAGDIIHGDLTTSNMIFTGSGLTFIDFGLGEKAHEVEKKGVDLHLLKEAIDSAHSEFPELFDFVISGYLAAYPDGDAVVRVLKDIETRGRYT